MNRLLPNDVTLGNGVAEHIERLGLTYDQVYDTLLSPDECGECSRKHDRSSAWPRFRFYRKAFDTDQGTDHYEVLVITSADDETNTIQTGRIWRIYPEDLGVQETKTNTLHAFDLFEAFLTKYGIRIETLDEPKALVTYTVFPKRFYWSGEDETASQEFTLPLVLSKGDTRLLSQPERLEVVEATTYPAQFHVGLAFAVNLTNYLFDIDRRLYKSPREPHVPV